MVHILALGVYSSGFIKDLLCLPRPLSPPLHRITLSKSAALEYGFPSTHSTNAVSVAVYALLLLQSDSSLSRPLNLALQIVSCLYALSIVFGRLYCGMHGFSDVLVGGLLGSLISCIQYIYGDAFDRHVQSASIGDAAAILLIILIFVRLHPVPVDNCPCFDDSVAFAGTVLGAEYGSWQFIGVDSQSNQTQPVREPFDLASVGWLATACRIVLGVIIIFLWRGMMKTAMLRMLPPIFRIIEKFGLTLPRKFFKQASEYSRIPKLRRDDNVIPAISELPSFLSSVRHPRKRAISIGPQSEADAYETLAYRENRRRESISTETRLETSSQDNTGAIAVSARAGNGSIPPSSQKRTSGDFDWPGMDDDEVCEKSGPQRISPSFTGQPAELKDEDVFLGIEKPRVRYDVEVVTKLVVYSGKLSSPAIQASRSN